MRTVMIRYVTVTLVATGALVSLIFATGLASADTVFGTTDVATDFTLVEQAGNVANDASSSFGGFDTQANRDVEIPAGLEGYDLEAPINVSN